MRVTGDAYNFAIIRIYNLFLILELPQTKDYLYRSGWGHGENRVKGLGGFPRVAFLDSFLWRAKKVDKTTSCESREMNKTTS